jgi:hypothetical protein
LVAWDFENEMLTNSIVDFDFFNQNLKIEGNQSHDQLLRTGQKQGLDRPWTTKSIVDFLDNRIDWSYNGTLYYSPDDWSEAGDFVTTQTH